METQSIEISDQIRLKPSWLYTFAEIKDLDMPPSLMHEFSSNSDNLNTLSIDQSDLLNQNISNFDAKHDDIFHNQNNVTSLDLSFATNSDNFEHNTDDLDHIMKTDTKKHRRKASAPQRAIPKEQVLDTNHEAAHLSESSQDGLRVHSQDDQIKTQNVFKTNQTLETETLEELKIQKLTNLDRLLDSESLIGNLLQDQVDQLIVMENGDWKKFLNEFEVQDIFKDLQEEGDGDTLEPEIFTNVKEEFKAHWGVKCNMCESVFPYKTEFDKHYRSSYNLNPVYTCTFCDKSVDKYTTFRSHCYRHITEGRFKCKQCSKGFSLQTMLQVHVLAKHTETKPFICEDCGKSFVTKPGLKIHLKKHRTELVKEDYPCVECGKVLHTRGGLTSHMNVHRLGRRFMCDICGKTFTQKVNMQQHVKQHTGNKPHECKLCGKGFTERSHLGRHLSYHSDERPYKCSTCNKMYKTERCLKVHTLVHAEARPYQCEFCKKGFLSNTKLKQHYNIHTGERPYKCKYCERAFTNYPNWLKHIRRRHKVNHKTGEELAKTESSTKKISERAQNNNNSPITENQSISLFSKTERPSVTPICSSQEKRLKEKKIIDSINRVVKANLNDANMLSQVVPNNDKIISAVNLSNNNILKSHVNDADVLPLELTKNNERSDNFNRDLSVHNVVNENLQEAALLPQILPKKSKINIDVNQDYKEHLNNEVSAKQLKVLGAEFSENEETSDKPDLDIETNLMLDKNLDLEGKSLVLNHKSMFLKDTKPCLKTIDRLVSEKLIENMHLQNNINENLLLNDLTLLKTEEMQELLAGNSSSPLNNYLVPYLQNCLPNQLLVPSSSQTDIATLHMNDILSSVE